MRMTSAAATVAVASLLLLGACSGGDKATDTAGEKTAAPASEAAAGMSPKAGLWEITTTAMGQTTPAVKVCVGETKPGENGLIQQQAGTVCAKNNVTKTAGGYAIDSECTANGVTAAISGTVTGDFSSAYKMETTTRMTGASIPTSMAEVKTAMDAKYLGACTADTQPAG